MQIKFPINALTDGELDTLRDDVDRLRVDSVANDLLWMLLLRVWFALDSEAYRRANKS